MRQILDKARKTATYLEPYKPKGYVCCVGLAATVSFFANVSTNFIVVVSGKNFCMSVAMPRLASWRPST